MSNKYYNSSQGTWIDHIKDDGYENENFENEIKGKLKSALQMPNIMVLAGSGTSLGDIVKGPKMSDLWIACTTGDMEKISEECFSECKYDHEDDNNKNLNSRIF